MNKESFLDLLDRYQQNKCSDNEKLFVENWYESLNSDDLASLNSMEVSKMSERILLRLYANMQRKTVLQIQPHTEAHSNTEKQSNSEIQSNTRIQFNSKMQPDPELIPQFNVKSARHTTLYKIGIAASVSIALIFTSLYILNYNNAERAFKNENAENALLSTTNTSDSVMTVTLSDHSTVALQPNATITYPTVFNTNSRKVYLKGDAFFEVSKNRARPFYVYNNKLKVRVLGTSFSIKEAEAQVAVRTGKVAVNENKNCRLFAFRTQKEAKGVLLTPNQKAVFDGGQHKIEKTLVDRPMPVPVNNHEAPELVSFKFSETSFREVFNTISKAYGIVIKLEDEKVNECTFTGDIDKKGLYEQLNLICESISGSYHIDGTNIFIKAKRCD